MSWIFVTLQWYFTLFVLGIIFFPLTNRVFAGFFPDRGYAFSKIISILFLSYIVFVLGILKVLSFNQINIISIIGLFALINGLIFLKDKLQTTNYKLQTVFLIIFEEFIFIAALFFWTFVRGQEPSIRGLEKFMDFGFINSILRSKYFPPLDMWLSKDTNNPNGYFINYYYFGHLSGAILIKLSRIKATFGYNLILSTVFALCVSQSFSLVVGIIYSYLKNIRERVFIQISNIKLVFFGLLGSFIVSLGGNLHTIYAFTSGYPNDNPIAFWKILSWYNPAKYWYPNATRFIPYTIHEFPSYSWVVADMHGHVYDIPFVLLTLAVLFIFFIKYSVKDGGIQNSKFKIQNQSLKIKTENKYAFFSLLTINYQLPTTIFLGFLTAVHYMTNAFDGPIYYLLIAIIFFYLYNLTKKWLLHIVLLSISFIVFILPFSIHFKPFVTGIGVNCSPGFLVKLQKIGPFIFEKGNCQVSPIWMLLILWGFFWINFVLFIVIRRLTKQFDTNATMKQCNNFIFLLFFLGTILIIIPEFFYIKDIYPAHFRANTMFKMGYQAFIMMGIASTYTFFKIKLLDKPLSWVFSFVFLFFFFFIAIYPLFSIPSYYGQLNRPVELEGAKWLEVSFPEDKEIIDFINNNIKGQPVILEAQGDSYTDFNRISAYTGVPTIAGWWVHEWLWRGSADVVGKRIPDIVNIYESSDIELTKELVRKYHVSYIVISKMERDKYAKLSEAKIAKIAKKIFESKNHVGALYQVKF